MMFTRILAARVVVGRQRGTIARFLMTSALLFSPLPQAVAQTSTTQPAGKAAPAKSLADARKGFKTKLTERIQSGEPVEKPPANVFRVVNFDAQPGKLAAYLTPDPRDGKKHPAIIWITGGDCSTIGDVWSDAPEENNQSADAYRKAGMVMMFPSLRGGNQNPGQNEGFFGEVDDILAAAKFLATQPYVDPARIYLGGHSTGGTLALLTAECSDTFRAVFAFGPVSNPVRYGFNSGVALPFNRRDKMELELRSPALWLKSIKTPTFVLEGETGNSDELKEIAAYKAANVRCYLVKGKDHFGILAPANKMIAAKILQDTKAAASIDFKAQDLPGLEPLRNEDAKPKQAGAARELVGTTEGNAGRYSFLRSPMVGIRYDLTQGGARQVLRSVSAFADKVLPVRGTEQTVQARDGYMVYGLEVDADRTVNAIRVIFVKIDGDKLLTDDTYKSDWLGTPQDNPPVTLGADGRRVTGIVMYTGRDQLNAIGLTFARK